MSEQLSLFHFTFVVFHYMHAFLSRPLFSALLDALPQNTWCKREDVYECREADYIAEVEGSLLFAKGQMILHLFKFFLQSKTSLSEDKIAQVSCITSTKRGGIRLPCACTLARSLT